MDLQLADQVAVVIGGASGIGRAIAEAFAQEHVHVALLDRAAQVGTVANEIGAQRRANARYRDRRYRLSGHGRGGRDCAG